MEALASQMQLLEDEARQSVQGMHPSLHSTSPGDTAGVSPATCNLSDTSSTSTVKRTTSIKFLTTLDNSVEEVDSNQDDSPDEEDEAFFDAAEIFSGDMKKTSVISVGNTSDSASSSLRHKRNGSTTSVNDVFSMKSSSAPAVKAICPQILSDLRMSVSRQDQGTYVHFTWWCHSVSTHYHISVSRYLLARPRASLTVSHWTKSGGLQSPPSHTTNSTCGLS